jgi:hypothetical protein
VSTLETKSSLQQSNELIKVTAELIHAEKILGEESELRKVNKRPHPDHHAPRKTPPTHLELLSVNDNVETANLSKAELLCVNAGDVDVFPDPVNKFTINETIRAES